MMAHRPNPHYAPHKRGLDHMAETSLSNAAI